jgi:DNA repair protein RadC
MPLKEKSALGEALPDHEPPQATTEPSPIVQLRQKVLRIGPRALSNTELLGLVLSAHRNHESSLACAERLVSTHGIEVIRKFTHRQWTREANIGQANGFRMTAVLELGRRLFSDLAEDRPRVGSPAEAYTLVRDLKAARKEHLVALYLDAQNHLILKETVSIGSLNTTRTHPREVMLPAIVHSALAFVLVHNHPSGSLEPSRDDVEFTRTMQKAGELMGVSLYDHIIVSSKGYVSLKEKGLL